MKVSIILSQTNLPQAVQFYCMRCRSQLFKQNRDVIAVYFGDAYPSREIPRDMGWVQLQCHSCKTEWNFYYQ